MRDRKNITLKGNFQRTDPYNNGFNYYKMFNEAKKRQKEKEKIIHRDNIINKLLNE